MGMFKEINDHISKFFTEINGNPKQTQKEIEKARIEKQIIEKFERERKEKLEKGIRAKEWFNVKHQIYSRYQLPIADDAKNIAKDLFGKNVETVSVFFITDERIVMWLYINGGDIAIDYYAKNLIEHAFIGGPITATLLRRLKLLKEAKNDGKVIDTEIDIDGFVPQGKILYAIDEIELDGQIIPAKRKFSVRCEMTATLTEGFRIGPFVPYNELYLSTKDEVEQITDEGLYSNDIKDFKEIDFKEIDFKERKYENIYHIEMCPHGTDRTLYCNQCQGDIIVSPSKKKIIGICLDISGSMEGNRIMRAKTAVINVLENIPINSNIDVVLIVFSSDITIHYEEIIPFGKKYTQQTLFMATKRVNALVPGGGTPLYDTINYFLDELWSGGYHPGTQRKLLDENRILYPYTYLIVVSDGDENGSKLEKLVYNGNIGEKAFFDKLKAYRDSGLVSEVIPFAYGSGGTNNRLIRDLKNISGKKLINEVNPENIIDSLVNSVDSILYGTENLKMMGTSMTKTNKN